MRVEHPAARRSTLRQTARGVEIIIPARRNLVAILFIGFWMGGWAVGEVFVLRTLITGDDALSGKLFMLVWLGGWTIGGIAVGASWLWMLAGRTELETANGLLTVRNRALGLGFTRVYDAAQIKRLRLHTRGNGMGWAKNEGPFAGMIAFDYGAKTLRLGAGLDEPEAQIVIDELREALRGARSADADEE